MKIKITRTTDGKWRGRIIERQNEEEILAILREEIISFSKIQKKDNQIVFSNSQYVVVAEIIND